MDAGFVKTVAPEVAHRLARRIAQAGATTVIVWAASGCYSAPTLDSAAFANGADGNDLPELVCVDGTAEVDGGRCEVDGDGDGFPESLDCDDSTPGGVGRDLDHDCDGVAQNNDCDDGDDTLLARADDGDCDRVLIADDCDDGDAESSVRAEDGDCDGVPRGSDCDDRSASIGSRVDDADCDGIASADDCDDHDGAVSARAADADCDGVPTNDDCNDHDPLIDADAHDGGAGVCVPRGQCSAGFHDGGTGTCVALGTCSAGHHDGGAGACVSAGSCSAGFAPDASGRCVDDCDQQSDCGSGRVCAATVAAGGLRGTCVSAAPSKRPTGAYCSSGSECQAGICAGFPALCGAYCVSEADCPANQNCVRTAISIAGVTATRSVCVEDASLTTLTCTSNADCAARGQLCDAVATSTTAACDHPAEGLGAIGDACSGAPTDFSSCSNGFCDSSNDGQCTAPCADDSDCGPSSICTASTLLGTSTRFCAAGCERMSDCGAEDDGSGPRVCVAACDAPDGTFEGRCAEPGPSATVRVGATSTDQNACLSGVSVHHTTLNQDYCTAPCTATADCPAVVDGSGASRQMECTMSLHRFCPDLNGNHVQETGDGPLDGLRYCARPAGFVDGPVVGTRQRIALLASVSSEQCVNFTLGAPRTITLETGDANGVTGCPGDTTARILSGGSQIAFDDDSGSGTCSRIITSQQPAGTYQACVGGYGGRTLFNVGVWLTLQ